MIRTRSIPAAIVLSLAAAGPGWATGNLSCSIDDSNLSFETEMVVPYGMGRPFLQMRAEAEIKAEGTPKPFRKIALGRKDLVHHWLDRSTGEIRLLFYRESRKPAASLELVVGATYDPEEPEGEGTYVLKLRTAPKAAGGEEQVVEFKGKSLCGAD